MQEAAGMVLSHDITKIVPGEFKGRAFAKGHVIALITVIPFVLLGLVYISYF